MKQLKPSKFYFFAIILLLIGCKEEDVIKPIVPPVITNSTTKDNAEVTFTSVKISGNVSPNNQSKVISRGVCWSTIQNPTITDKKTVELTDSFISEIKELEPGKKYYFRVYAEYEANPNARSAGVSYGPEIEVSTISIANTTWDFFIDFSREYTWHADVDFLADGTTIYEEPEFPGLYTTYGTWEVKENKIIYILDPSITAYHFTGTIDGNKMEGTFNFKEENKKWTAVLKE